ncbi:MAG: hypothetical protein HYX43_07280 [Burkholderiales bacterium]|nr:hypothetical protein [Burkholderiales bacterium]
MTFCTQCGHKNEADGRFCAECGKPLRATSAAQPAPQQPNVASAAPIYAGIPDAAAPSVSGKKMALITGIGALVIAIAAGIAAFTFRSESPSNALFSDLIEQSLLANPTAYKPHYCLSNFAYDKDPVLVSSMDSGTQRWMAVLTKAGLYSEPQTITQENGFFSTEQLRYQKTEAGKKATDGRSLCYADGVTVKSIDSFTPPITAGEMQVSRANVRLQLKNPMPWITQAETRQAGTDVQTEFQDEKVFVLRERKWVLATNADIQAAQSGIRSREQSQSVSTSSGTGFVSSLLKLFGGHRNPLIGHWKSSFMGIDALAFEFDSDSMTSSGGKVKVRYEVTEKDVTVYPQGQEVGLVFKVIDANTMSLNTGIEVQLKRIQ